MSAAPQQLSEIHQQLKDYFSGYKSITVAPVQGDPPDRYEITYHIKGLKKLGEGNIIEAGDHVVEIAIPFGFPHFPPSCKPKSNIFHPDFDPAAVCLGDFWHQDCLLSDLILHIGRMINGELYSTTNAFNEEACLWYVSHPDTFPLAEIDWRQSEPDFAGSNEIPSIDTLDENDLSTPFDFLSRDEREEEPTSPSPAAELTAAHDLDQMTLLARQKKYFTLYENIKGGAESLPEELQRLFSKAEKIVRKAEDWHRDAQRCERRGDVRGAISAFEKISEHVEDFPDLELHLERLRLFIDLVPGSSEPESQVMADEGTDHEFPAKSVSKKSNDVPPAKGRPAVSAWRLPKKLIFFILGAIVTACLTGGGYLYRQAVLKLDKADTALSQCDALLEKDLFQDAERSCEEARTVSEGLGLIFHGRVEQLRAQVDRILQSERMIQGLKGMVLIDGRYLAKKEIERMETYRQLRSKAEEHYTKEEWLDAVDLFAKILALPEISQLIPTDVVTEVKTKHDLARFRQVYDFGRQSLENGKWQEAVTELSKAEGLIDLLPEDDRPRYASSLTSSLTKGSFELARENGDLYFAGSEWQKAMAAYEQALSTPGMDALSAESLENARRNMKRAQLYNLIDQGRKAFGAGAWDKAIGDYRQAEELLANHKAHLNVTDADEHLKKLSKIILQALIVRDRQAATGHVEKNELSTARGIYRQLIDRIDKSPFSKEGEFLAAKKDAVAAVQTLDEKIFIAEKSKYLEDQYRSLFAANYPAAVAENLINPIISFTKDSGDKAVFRMQCTETGGGRPLTLVMYYAFDRKNGRWEFHTQPQ